MAKAQLNLRTRTPISYYEPEEPSFDEYLYCEQCSDYVYEYCAIHGHLLVVPDDKVPIKTNFPSYVPRAALTIPHVFLHIAPSIIPGAGLGVFSTLTLPRGVRFGPYRGQHTKGADSMYCWQIYDNNNKRSHVVDAADGERSNWMRYVNCARHWREQNLLAYQYKGQLYYRTIKIIPRFTELMVFYGSEFANVLHINLSKYNSDNYNQVIKIHRTRVTTVTNEDETISTNASEACDDNRIEEGEMDQQFELNEQVENKENNQNNANVIGDSRTNLNEEISPNDKSYPYNVNVSANNALLNFKPSEQIRFTCEICLKTFTRARNMRTHVKLHNTLYNCELCVFRTNRKESFNKHNETHLKSYQYHCDTCYYKTDTKRYLQKHLLRHINNRNITKCQNINIKANDVYFSKPRKCEICEFETYSRSAFSTHMSKHKGKTYKCDHCEYSSYAKYNLLRHILKKHLKK